MTFVGPLNLRRMRSAATAAACAIIVTPGVGPAAADDLPGPAAPPQQFQIADSFCFLPCMAGMKSGAKDHQDDVVTISRAELTGPMIAPCDGRVAVTVKEGSQEDVMEDLHRRYGDEALTSAAQIVLPAGHFQMGSATCTPRGGTPSTLARFLSIEPERVTLLTDSGIVYELVPEKR